MFFNTLDEVNLWLEQRFAKRGRSANDGPEDTVVDDSKRILNSTKFCTYFYNHKRCGLPFGHATGTSAAHILYADNDRVIFGDEARQPAVNTGNPPRSPRWNRCGIFSGEPNYGQCELKFSHAGGHNYQLLDAEWRKDRCNTYRANTGHRCRLKYGHADGHDWEPAEGASSRDLVVLLPATERPCKLTSGCTGRMVATMKKYAEAQVPALWWFCKQCNHQISYATGRVVAASISESLHRAGVALKKEADERAEIERGLAALAGDGGVVDATAEVAEASVDTNSAASDAALMGAHIRDIMNEE